MKRKSSILVLSNLAESSLWLCALRRALSPLYNFHTKKEDNPKHPLSVSEYDMIIVDAGSITDMSERADTLRKRYGDTHLVVLTDSPTWEEARAALLAGATDYFRKSLDEIKIRDQVQAFLEAHAVASTDYTSWRSD